MNDFLWFINVFFDLQISFFCLMSGVLMLFCVLLQDYSSAEHDDEEERVSCYFTNPFFLHWLYFLVSFKLNFYKRIGSCLSSLNHNAQLSVLRVSNTRWVGFFIISEKTAGKTSPCFIGCKHPSIRLNILQLSMTEFSSLILWLWTLFFPIL